MGQGPIGSYEIQLHLQDILASGRRLDMRPPCSTIHAIVPLKRLDAMIHFHVAGSDFAVVPGSPTTTA